MILVHVSDHQANQAIAALRNEARIGNQNFHLGMFGPAKAKTAIDGKPPPIAPIKIEVQANLTRPAQWQEG
jgi:hypothetical protein